MLRHSRLILSCALIALVAGCASTTGGESSRMNASFNATNNFLVVPGPGSGEFTVLARGGSAARDFFCAAGDYAYRRLGASPTSRVELVANIGRNPAYNGTRTGTFRVVGQGGAERSGLSVSSKAGENLSVAHARAMDCRPPAIRERSR
jgi:hypothetical protein